MSNMKISKAATAFMKASLVSKGKGGLSKIFFKLPTENVSASSHNKAFLHSLAEMKGQ